MIPHRLRHSPILLQQLGTALARGFQDDTNLLAVLAQVCNSFSHPMLKILWRNIPSLLVLFPTLPLDAWSAEVTVEYDRRGRRKVVTCVVSLGSVLSHYGLD